MDRSHDDIRRENTGGKATKSAHSVSAVATNSHTSQSWATQPLLVQQRPRDPQMSHRVQLKLTLNPPISATSSQRWKEKAHRARSQGAFMCRQTLPSFHCCLRGQTHALGGETILGAWVSGAGTWPYVELCTSEREESLRKTKNKKQTKPPKRLCESSGAKVKMNRWLIYQLFPKMMNMGN